MMTHLVEAVLWLSVGILWWIFYWPNRRYQLDRAPLSSVRDPGLSVRCGRGRDAHHLR